MKNIIKLSAGFFILAFNLVSAQNNMFFASYPSTWDRVQPTNNGYILLSFGDSLKWAKTDNTGTIIIAKAFSKVSCTDAKFLNDNSAIITGPVSGDSIFLLKIDSSGNLVWVKGYSVKTSVPVSSYNVNVSPSKYHGNFWLTGSGGASFNHAKGFVLKADSLGNILLKKEIDSIPVSNYLGAGPMVEGDNNSCYFTSDVVYDETSGYPDNTVLFKTDSMLNVKWAVGLGYGMPGTLLYDGKNIILGWSTTGLFSMDLTVFPSLNITKVDTAGLNSNELLFNENYFGSVNAMQFTHDKGTIVSGGIAIGAGVEEPFAFKIDSTFNLQWSKVYGIFSSFNNYWANDIKITPDNGFIMAGNYLIKTDSNGLSGCNDSVYAIGHTLVGGLNSATVLMDTLHVGTFPFGVTANNTHQSVTYQCYTITGIEPPTLPSGAVTIFPNPNNGAFTLRVKSEELRDMSIMEVYNVLGEKIYSSRLTTTNTAMDFSGNTSGIYLYRVITDKGNLVSQGKFIIQH